MKQILYLLVGIFLLASCQQEELPDAGTNYGYLAVSGLSVASTHMDVISSRAEASEEPLTIEILKDGETVQILSETDLENKIKLEAGTDYALKVYSSEYGKDTEWESNNPGVPVYYAEQSFEISTDKTTQVQVKVPMVNFGVSFQFPEEYQGAFSSCTLNVTVGERTVALQSGETAYFPCGTETTVFHYSLVATNIDKEEISTEENTYGDVADETVFSGTIYAISYEMEPQSFSVMQ